MVTVPGNLKDPEASRSEGDVQMIERAQMESLDLLPGMVKSPRFLHFALSSSFSLAAGRKW